MRGVVEAGGTGHRAYIPEYPVAGKTGTGQKPHLRKRGYSEDMWVNTFLGVVPANHPELAIAILVDEPTAKRHGGGLIAAPTFKRIANFALRHLGIASPYVTGKRQAWLNPELLAKRRALKPDAGQLDRLGPPVSNDQAGDVPVPDFRGVTMDQALILANEIGLAIRLQGSGKAIAQSPAAHLRVPAGSEVVVTFQPTPRQQTEQDDGPGRLPTGTDSKALPIDIQQAPKPAAPLPLPPEFGPGGQR